jgi:predicted GNAT family acetyltransferase
VLTLERFDSPEVFLAAAEPWLAEREAEHNLILGIAGNLARDPGSSDGPPPYLALVRGEAGPVAVCLRTPPYNLVLSEVDDLDALALIADDLAGEPLPGVTGPPAAAEHFGRVWTARHGGRFATALRERVYRLTRVRPARPTSGAPRRATLADRALLEEWLLAFHAEALPEEGDERVRRQIADWDPATGRAFWLWEEEEVPVSLVGAGSPTPNGIRIGPVYTPVDRRGRGYASNLTAFVSQRALDEGRRFCFLYTDLANPTSNAIYQRIGYEAVCDAVMLQFVPG